jgi:hypothetical protein
MWPFKRSKDLSTLPSLTSDDQEWSVLQMDDDGSPLLIRRNDSAKAWKGHPGLTIKLGFAIPLNAPNPGGMPDPDESLSLNDVEDQIVAEVGENAKGLLVMVLTNGVMREFVFYIAEGADIGRMHQTLQERVKSHEVQCMAMKDPSWEAYAAFSP